MLKRIVPVLRRPASYLGNWRVKVDDRVGTCVKFAALAVEQEIHLWLRFANGLVSEFKLSDLQRADA